MNITFEQLRAESQVLPLLEQAMDFRGNKSYEALMNAVYGGWMDESVLMAGLLFSELMNRAGAPAAIFTTPILEMVFSVARGSDDDYDSEVDWRKQRHAWVEEFLEWSEAFLSWSNDYRGDTPLFNWNGFALSMRRYGVVSPSSMMNLDLTTGVTRGMSGLRVSI